VAAAHCACAGAGARAYAATLQELLRPLPPALAARLPPGLPGARAAGQAEGRRELPLRDGASVARPGRAADAAATMGLAGRACMRVGLPGNNAVLV